MSQRNPETLQQEKERQQGGKKGTGTSTSLGGEGKVTCLEESLGKRKDVINVKKKEKLQVVEKWGGKQGGEKNDWGVKRGKKPSEKERAKKGSR